jgi:hypothetical protein
MAARKTNPKVMDVSKPGKTKVTPTSRPVIVGRGRSVKDATVNESLPAEIADESTSKRIKIGHHDLPNTTLVAPHAAPISQTKKKIMPLSEDEKSEHFGVDIKTGGAVADSPATAGADADSAPEGKPDLLMPNIKVDANTEPQTEADVVEASGSSPADAVAKPFDLTTSGDAAGIASPAADDSDGDGLINAKKPAAKVPAAVTPPAAAVQQDEPEDTAPEGDTAEQPADGSDDNPGGASDSAAVGALADQVGNKKVADKAVEEASLKTAAVNEAIESKKYYVPIGKDNTKRRGNGGLIILLVLLVLAAAAYLALDAGIVKIPGFDVPYDIIG